MTLIPPSSYYRAQSFCYLGLKRTALVSNVKILIIETTSLMLVPLLLMFVFT